MYDINVHSCVTADVEMNWNLVKFLPEAGSCQTNFNVGYFVDLLFL